MVNAIVILLQRPYTCSKLLTVCKYLKKPEYRIRQHGLCFNIQHLFEQHFKNVSFLDAETLLHAIWEQWPKYSGNPKFPVPAIRHGVVFAPYDCENRAARLAFRFALSNGDFYCGEYGALRLELLDFTIQTLEAHDGK